MPRQNTAAKPAAVPEAAAAADLYESSLYVNRELSLLSFQRRVLDEAKDKTNPILERMKFLAIVGSNLDEFFMVRVAGLLAQVDAGITEVGPDGLTPRAQLTSIRREVTRLFTDARCCLVDEVIPALEEAGIFLVDYSDLTPTRAAAADKYFAETVFPVLTPLAFDPGRPFPHISNLSLNLAVLIRDAKGGEHFARIKVPDTLPQLVPLTERRLKHNRGPRRTEIVWLEQVIAANLASLFPGMEVAEAYPFHVTRDGDIAIRELEAEDLLETIEQGVRQRRFGSVVRLLVSPRMPRHILRILMNNLEIDATEVYRTAEPLGLARLMSAYKLDRPELKYQPFVPRTPPRLVPEKEDEDVFTAVRRGDVLMHHPFESFQPVVDFLRSAAEDDDVLAIKVVLYRVGRNSPVVDALLHAARNGKQVAALVELKARFDEESNIEWARKLENQGVHVVYGLLGLKIHCKVTLVVRREGRDIRRYVHLSTGNYNAVTAHFYTDIGLLTCDEQIAEEATHLFNYLTGYSVKSDYRSLLVAPVNLRSQLRDLIEREIEHTRKGREGRIIFKMNSLVDPAMIRALYRASQAGVRIDLLIRGICCLRPGVPGISERIQVTSIVGRFLEHSRIYYFGNGGKEEMYLGSADLMPRNLDRRVEVVFPIRDESLVHRIRHEILAIYMADTVKARRMLADGRYVRRDVKSEAKRVDSQSELIRLASSR